MVLLQCAFTRNFARAQGGNWSNWTNWTALRNILPLCGWNLLDQRMHWTTAGGASDDLSRSQSDNKRVR